MFRALMAPRLISGDPGAALCSDVIAVVAHFDAKGQLDASSRSLLRGLDNCGIPSILVTTADTDDDVIESWDVPDSAVLYARENRGYDFGSWAVALRTLPGLAQKTVILTNNSMLGPFEGLRSLLEVALADPADVWAVTSSLQITSHLQSYFLRFRQGVLAEPALAAHFRSVRHLRRKMAIVRKYELGLTEVVNRAGLRTGVWRSPEQLGVGADNPTLRGWHELLDSGYPFLKRTLLNDQRVLVGADVLADAVRARYGVELADYL